MISKHNNLSLEEKINMTAQEMEVDGKRFVELKDQIGRAIYEYRRVERRLLPNVPPEGLVVGDKVLMVVDATKSKVLDIEMLEKNVVEEPPESLAKGSFFDLVDESKKLRPRKGYIRILELGDAVDENWFGIF